MECLNNRNLSLRVLEVICPRPGSSVVRFWVELSSWLVGSCLLAVSSSGGRGWERHRVFNKGTHPIAWWLRGKESACNAGDTGSIPGLGRSPGGGKRQPTLVSLPGELCGQRAWWAIVQKGSQSWIRLCDSACMDTVLHSDCTILHSHRACHVLSKVRQRIRKII